MYRVAGRAPDRRPAPAADAGQPDARRGGRGRRSAVPHRQSPPVRAAGALARSTGHARAALRSCGHGRQRRRVCGLRAFRRGHPRRNRRAAAGGAQRARRVSLGTVRWRIGRADVCPAGSAGVAPGAGESLGAHECGRGAGVSRRLLRPQAPQPRILEADGDGSFRGPEGRGRLPLEPAPGTAGAGRGRGDQRRRRALSRTDARRRQRLQGPDAACS